MNKPLAACLLAMTAFTACSRAPETPFALTPVATPAGTGSAQPHLARGPAGEVVLSWLEPDGRDSALKHSVLRDGAWGPARTVAHGSNWFVNWADFPSVSPMTDSLWASHWLVRRPGGTYAYDVAISISDDAGTSWSDPVTPHDDGTPTEHGFVTLFPWQSGIGALWLDGRNMTGDGHAGHGSGDPAAGMTLRSAIISSNGEITDPQLVDELVCDCCQTDVALAAAGPVAVYRNRTVGEIRDIYLARALEGRWQPGTAVVADGWEISGCPVNGPAIAASSQDVAIAWFTAASNQPRVRFARSTDGGATFSAPLDIGTAGANGRVDVEILADGTAVVSWLRTGPAGTGELALRRVGTDNRPGPVQVVVQTSTARLSGFPQILRQGDQLVLAWTDSAGPATVVRTAMVGLP